MVTLLVCVYVLDCALRSLYLGKYLYMLMNCCFLLVALGAIALIQLQEDMKKQLNEEGNYSEGELDEYLQSHKKVMIDSLWKLNVADIEATLSRVCQMVVFLSLLFLAVGWHWDAGSKFVLCNLYIFYLRFFKTALPRRRSSVRELRGWKLLVKSSRYFFVVPFSIISCGYYQNSYIRWANRSCGIIYRGLN